MRGFLCLNVDIDIRQVIEDVKHFGVSAPEFKRTAKIYNITNTEYCWTIDGNSELHHVLMCVGGFYEIDGKLNRRVPSGSRPVVCRLSASSYLQGSYGGGMVDCNLNNTLGFKPVVEETKYITHNESLFNSLRFIGDVTELFDDLNIKTCTNNSVYLYDFTTVRKIVDKPENMCVYADAIHYTYSEKSGLTPRR
jgi:hypothetical protein